MIFFSDIETVLEIAQITMGLLCIMLGLALWTLFNQIQIVKEAIALVCAADPELTTKVNKLLKSKVEVPKIKGGEK